MGWLSTKCSPAPIYTQRDLLQVSTFVAQTQRKSFRASLVDIGLVAPILRHRPSLSLRDSVKVIGSTSTQKRWQFEYLVACVFGYFPAISGITGQTRVTTHRNRHHKIFQGEWQPYLFFLLHRCHQIVTCRANTTHDAV